MNTTHGAQSDDAGFDGLTASGNGARRRGDGQALQVVYHLMAVLLVVLLAWLPVQMVMSYERQRNDASRGADVVSSWSRSKIETQRAAADAYNRSIAASPQNELGDSDPFSDPQSGEDEEERSYDSLLDEGHGVMGSIIIPKVSVDLPIRHGTSADTLAMGAGHLYGTSLPVGGKSTNSVIAAHRGLPQSMMFSRLGELKIGDTFTVNTLDEPKGYRIVGIHVVEPDDAHLYKVFAGQDMVTLMTCTPLGINTHRLVITGIRDDGARSKVQRDALLPAVLVWFAVLLVGCAVARYLNARREGVRPIPAHAVSSAS